MAYLFSTGATYGLYVLNRCNNMAYMYLVGATYGLYVCEYIGVIYTMS